MKNLFIILTLLLFTSSVYAEEFLLSTPRTSLLLTGEKDGQLYLHYFGRRVLDPSDIWNSGNGMLYREAYPQFGLDCTLEPAMAVMYPDGNLSLDLRFQKAENIKGNHSDEWKFYLKDTVYPLEVTLHYRIYHDEDIIESWAGYQYSGKGFVELRQFASAYMPLPPGQYTMQHLHGSWASEHQMEEEILTHGSKILVNRDGVRNALTDHPSVMLGRDGLEENTGDVYAGILAWSGNYKINCTLDNSHRLHLIAGIDNFQSEYKLSKGETFVTPAWVMSYSNKGKGEISRTFHRWARKYALAHGEQKRDILLNSWEGLYFNVNMKDVCRMINDFSGLGGEMFVLDDGWFGKKYSRDSDRSSLGDWEVSPSKLPDGLQALIDSCKCASIRFGIWIEPEMTNTISELYEQHPDWVISQPNRPLKKGRGGNQLVLDLSNPKVQDFIFGVVDKLMTQYPEIAYIKWDANMSLANYGSNYLPANKQSHLYIEYHRGLRKVLQRIRAKYPDLLMQACASGGGRISYGILPYFDEFWTSDDTDAIERIYMQWGVSQFYPAIAMGSHVSAARNHQTNKLIPLKFRFDVAMSGRLGMEMQPKDFTPDEYKFAAQAISTYKQIRPVVQFGDLYRLISPYAQKNISSLMYVTPDKEEAVLFVYQLKHRFNPSFPRLTLQGRSPEASYEICEINTADLKEQAKKTITGGFLIDQGMEVWLDKEYDSKIFHLKKTK